MAANKFSTMLQKNCHKIIVILVYALLEWILIILLLLNSIFSYLISKFANSFGLKPSCTYCSKSNHIFDSKKHENFYDHVCETHGNEISKLSYCPNHKKLSKSKNLCGNCSFSRPVENGKINEMSSTVALFTWLNENVSENGDQKNQCSCCDEILIRKQLTWDVLDDYYIHEKGFIDTINDEEQATTHSKSVSHSYDIIFPNRGERLSGFEVHESNGGPFCSSAGCNEDDESVYIRDMLLQNEEYLDSDRFICIELIDSPSVASQKTSKTSSENIGEINGSDLDTNETSSRLIDEYERRDEDIEKCRQIFSGAALNKEEELENFTDIQVEEKRHSFDESQVNEMQIDDNSLTKEQLKATLRAQQEALNELYLELEEERKAAAIAANEIMTMITKLQEEKSAIQMEALQYQRMMEEQAEYDQEALQLLNDLMIKREKEKLELEKELNLYRNDVMDYENGGKTMMVKCINSSISSSQDYSQEHNLDDVMEDFDEHEISLAEFDEERLSILEELKFLEAKLLASHNHETHNNINVTNDEEKGTTDTSSDDKNRFERKTTDLRSKKLLPLFDATDNEFTEDSLTENELEKSKLIQDEFVNLYERLQALEADKEFLKHCIRSMMKGNKGLSLLQEILQHLRDLRSVELSAEKIAHFSIEDLSLDKKDQW